MIRQSFIISGRKGNPCVRIEALCNLELGGVPLPTLVERAWSTQLLLMLFVQKCLRNLSEHKQSSIQGKMCSQHRIILLNELFEICVLLDPHWGTGNKKFDEAAGNGLTAGLISRFLCF